MFSFEYLIKYVLTLADIPVWTLRFHSGTCSNLENLSWSGSWKISLVKSDEKGEFKSFHATIFTCCTILIKPQWIEWICYYTVTHQGVLRHEQFGRADTSYSYSRQVIVWYSISLVQHRYKNNIVWYTRQVISHKLLLDARQGKHVPLPLLCTKITILNNNT